MKELNLPPPLLAPGDVARMLGVDPQTVYRWGRSGKLASVVTPGGHRRYRLSDVQALVDGKADDE